MKKIIIVSLVYFFIFSPAVSSANPSTKNKICTLIILDRISINDIEKLPNLKKIAFSGVTGLMNTRCAGNYEPAGSYLTIGAGTRASASGKGKIALMDYEIYNSFEAGKIYKSFTGNEIYGKILVPEIPLIIEENLKQDHEIIPGLLGETLKKRSIPVSLLGNADKAEEMNRLAALIAMDEKGQIWEGKLEGINIFDENSPFFLTLNYEKLFQEYLKYRSLGGLIVIYIGDSVRADEYYRFSDKNHGESTRLNALIRADSFIGKVADTVDFSEELLMIVTPFPSYKSLINREYLTPVILKGNILKSGFATSETTKRKGIVANIDIAPTILSFFGINAPYPMLGKAIYGIDSENTLSFLQDSNKKITANYTARPNIIKTYVFLHILSLILFLSYIFKLLDIKPGFMIFFFLFNLSSPASMLFPFIYGSPSLFHKFTLWVITSLAVILIPYLLFKNFQNPLYSIAFLSIFTASIIFLDLLLGANFMKTSILGYDVIAGARYYGIGNEYMGVFFSSIITGISSLFEILKLKDNYKKNISIALFLVTFILIFSPDFGSNFGGGIAALGGFLYTYVLYFYKKTDFKVIIKYILLGTIIFVLFLLIFILYGPPSHFTLLFLSIKNQGFNPLFLVISRKLLMNYRLFKYTPWTKALIFSIITLLILVKWPVGLFKKLSQDYPFLFKGIKGANFGTLLALVFNDSGIVAAATSMIFSFLPLLILSVKECEERR
ncbi:MAG: hypothetical protein ACPLOV_02320 [Thermovenabulum sp.]